MFIVRVHKHKHNSSNLINAIHLLDCYWNVQFTCRYWKRQV